MAMHWAVAAVAAPLALVGAVRTEESAFQNSTMNIFSAKADTFCTTFGEQSVDDKTSRFRCVCIPPQVEKKGDNSVNSQGEWHYTGTYCDAGLSPKGLSGEKAEIQALVPKEKGRCQCSEVFKDKDDIYTGVGAWVRVRTDEKSYRVTNIESLSYSAGAWKGKYTSLKVTLEDEKGTPVEHTCVSDSVLRAQKKAGMSKNAQQRTIIDADSVAEGKCSMITQDYAKALKMVSRKDDVKIWNAAEHKKLVVAGVGMLVKSLDCCKCEGDDQNPVIVDTVGRTSAATNCKIKCAKNPDSPKAVFHQRIYTAGSDMKEAQTTCTSYYEKFRTWTCCKCNTMPVALEVSTDQDADSYCGKQCEPNGGVALAGSIIFDPKSQSSKRFDDVKKNAQSKCDAYDQTFKSWACCKCEGDIQGEGGDTSVAVVDDSKESEEKMCELRCGQGKVEFHTKLQLGLLDGSMYTARRKAAKEECHKEVSSFYRKLLDQGAAEDDFTPWGSRGKKSNGSQNEPEGMGIVTKVFIALVAIAAIAGIGGAAYMKFRA